MRNVQVRDWDKTCVRTIQVWLHPGLHSPLASAGFREGRNFENLTLNLVIIVGIADGKPESQQFKHGIEWIKNMRQLYYTDRKEKSGRFSDSNESDRVVNTGNRGHGFAGQHTHHQV
ncbi:hypothetical protein RRG08_000869 [Elysia crispata]|uniref:Uncharacterized protein n=1 Tax=Elysia crispata TaxID=231223 RepID=A0AAE0XTS9_9GAST|nr:hypothetical protein RRG08_000869 [Elysia crispata]